MRIAVLSDPNNFHTQKWVKALQGAGAEVIVLSYDAYKGTDLEAIQLVPPSGEAGRYNYLDYVRGGEVLMQALKAHRIDVVNPLNITPFAVWAANSGFHPVVACAFGADILEYPPRSKMSPAPDGRIWESVDATPGRIERWKVAWKRRYFRKKVAQALRHADLVTGDNQFLVDCMHDWFGLPIQKLEVLRWGVEPELFEVTEEALQELRTKLGIGRDQKVVLSPRGAKPIYQTDIILEAFGQVLAAGRSDTFFLQLGAGYAISPAIQAKAHQLEATYPHFRFVAEALSREQLHALWNLVDVFISAPVYDGYSAALAEGRYIGAIPVVNDIPATRELIVHDENGWVCNPFSSAKLAADLQHVLDHCEAYKTKFAAPNRAWILAHSLMAENARRFLQLAQKQLSAKR